jgi:hypothetical protein
MALAATLTAAIFLNRNSEKGAIQIDLLDTGLDCQNSLAEQVAACNLPPANCRLQPATCRQRVRHVTNLTRNQKPTNLE